MILKKNSYSSVDCWNKGIPKSGLRLYGWSIEFSNFKKRSQNWSRGRGQNIICTGPREESSHWSKNI